MYTVYIIRCTDGSLYTGITNNLQRRFALHCSGKASRYTRSRGVDKIVYTQNTTTKSSALKREAQIKRLSREKKLDLFAKKA